MTRVYIDGREGTTGLRIYERLSARADVEMLIIDPTLRKDVQARKRLLNLADVAFLCMPDAAAVEAVKLMDDPDTILIDASTAHRTLDGWAYGLPELSEAHRRSIAGGKRITVPGCHASGFIALTYPLIQAGVLPPDYPVVCHSVTGYSGGGKGMIAEYQAEDRTGEFDSPRQYGLSQRHKHLKEMKAISGLSTEPVFTPIVADFYSGMVVTVPLFTKLLKGPASLADLHALLSEHYRGQKLVRVLPMDDNPGFLGSNNLSGCDSMEIAVFGNDERVILTARFDNLGKGASGAAVQCMNIALGLPETTSLID